MTTITDDIGRVPYCERGWRWPRLLSGLLLAACIPLLPCDNGLGAQIAGSASAKAEIAQSKEAMISGNTGAAIEALRRAIALDGTLLANPDRFFFLLLSGDSDESMARTRLRALFGTWTAREPATAVLHYLLGKAWEPEIEIANTHYLRAVTLEPSLVSAHAALARNAGFLGEHRASAARWKTAAELRPNDSQYLFSRAIILAERDVPGWREAAQDVLDRFPRTEVAASVLFLLGKKATRVTEKIGYLERATREHPQANSSMGENATVPLFELHARTDARKALAFARRMVEENVRSYVNWQHVVAMQETIVHVRALLDARKSADALLLLHAATPAANVRRVPFDLLVIEAEEAAGQKAEAYAHAADLVAKRPRPDLRDALLAVGRRLGKTSQQVEADLRALRDARATRAQDFDLENYSGGSRISLRAYAGKVVLLNFWHPG